MPEIAGLDYPTLWFLVIGGLFSGYAVLDGFDLGAGAWHLFLRKEQSRRVALNAIGPVWDGNEVWLVIGGGALFAGFPEVYSTLLSGMYIPFMLFLVLIIFRAVSIEFRSKEEMKWWKRTWDISYSLSSISLSLLLGIVLGNVVQGMPIGADHEFAGNWLFFLNPYAVIVGLTTLSIFMLHGALFLTMKTEGRLFAKLTILVKRSLTAFFLMMAILTVYTLLWVPGLSDRILTQPWLISIPFVILIALVIIPQFVQKRRYQAAFGLSSLIIMLLLIVVAVELYPVVLPSSLGEEFSITIYNGSSSIGSLRTMLIIAAIGAPLVLSYTIFVYRTFRGKVQLDETSY